MERSHSIRAFISGRRGCSVVLSLLFLAGYAVSNAWGYHVGESAASMARTLGAHPFPTLDHPIWEMVARSLASILPRPAVLQVLSGLCAVLAAWSVGLACSFAWRMAELPGLGRERRWEKRSRKPRRKITTPKLICRAGGLWAGLILGLHMPVVIAATRPMAAAFDLWLVLLALNAAAAAAVSRRSQPQMGAALLMGIAAGEHPAAIPIVLVSGLWMLWRMLMNGLIRIPGITKSREQRWRLGVPLACGAIILLAAAAPWLIKAGLVRFHPAGVWLGYDTYGRALRDLAVIARDQYRIGWPSRGGLLVFMVTALPATLVFFAAWGADTRRPTLTMLVLLVPMALSGALVFNISLSPWRLFGMAPLSIWPGLVIALWAGAMGALWSRVAWVEWKTLERAYPAKSKPVPASWRWVLGWGLPAAVGILAVWGAIRTRAFTYARGVEPIRASARAVLDDLPPDGWLVTSGGLDDLLRLAVYERGWDVKLVSLAQMSQPPMRRYLASVWSTDMELSGLVEYVPNLALIEWLKSDGGRRTMVFDLPELWAAAGAVAEPRVWTYAGRAGLSAAEDLVETSETARQTSGAMQDLARRLGDVPSGLERIGLLLRLQLSRIANDHGVQHHARGDVESARTWYEYAVRLCGQNPVAGLNLQAWSRSETDIAEQARRFAESNRNLGDFDAWIVARGGSLSPDLMRALYSGTGGGSPDPDRPSPALRLDAALRLGVSGPRTAPDPASTPQADPAMFAAADVFSRMGEENGETVDEALRRMRERYPADPLTDLAELMVRTVRNQGEESRRLEESLLARNIPIPNSLAVSLARLDWQEGMVSRAMERIGRILRADPRFVPALELRLLIAIQSVSEEDAQKGAAALLAADPHHPLGLQTVASFLIERERYPEAEALLRRAMARKESSGLLNDLAWVLARLGRPQEAEPLARRALESPDAQPTYADTLIEVLQALQRGGEARRVLDDARKKWPDDPGLKARDS